MENIIVEVSHSGKNFCAYTEALPGCIATGKTFDELKEMISEGIIFHIDGMQKDNDPIPFEFTGEYCLVYKLSTEALLNAYNNIFTKAALSRITGINERQLWHYAAGVRKPRFAQVKRIEDGLHKLGRELLSVIM
jgi:predicted RNase H-like HicB family nuclease